ncbi:MAG: biotin--[acetyl-CoA-carboxylase] ligase [Pseudomonadota bacterium]
MELEPLNQCLAELCHGNRIPRSQWPEAFSLDEFGLQIDAQSNVFFPSVPQCLDTQELASQFRAECLLLFPAIDSTNSQLLRSEDPIDGKICTAEIQLGGRGRRGRQWMSPFARNLAISMGFRSDRELSQLGGLSLVVGLALVDVFQSLGMENVGLKWPNDVLIEGQKCCGILVELVNGVHGTEIVVGFGVNVSLTDAEIRQIDQPVTDLRRQGIKLTRTRLLILLAKSVGKHVAHFDEHGLERFVSAFDAVHVFQDKECRVLQGDQTFTGRVDGVELDGGLRIEADGQMQVFHGGEVSLRHA